MSKVIEDLIGNTTTGTFCWHHLQKLYQNIFRVEKVPEEKKSYDGIVLKIYYGSQIPVTQKPGITYNTVTYDLVG